MSDHSRQLDPVFPLEHGKQLVACIPKIHLEIIEKIRHALPDEIRQKILVIEKHFERRNV